MVSHQSKNFSIVGSKRTVLQHNNIKYVIKQSQSYMLELTQKLNYIEPFNNTVRPHDCVDRLVAHRIVSKFHLVDPSRAEALQQAAYDNYITYDKSLSTRVDVDGHADLRRARFLLGSWFKNFRVDIAAANYEVTPGETFISSGGEVSLLAKLFSKKHWTTTANCLDDTCVFIYNNASFRRAARQHIGVVTRRERRNLYLRFKHKPDIGFHVFSHLLKERVLILTDGARASTVPKSNEKRRFINVEAMFPVILQRMIAKEILAVLKRVGNDLGNVKFSDVLDRTGHSDYERSAQSLHGSLIKDSSLSTIDFSNASDSVTLAAVCALFPKKVYDLLLRTRSHYVAIEGELFEPTKLSSMGNGYTFEVMTAMLFAIGKGMTDRVRVYGDDVIVPNAVASRFVDTCSLIDFRVNSDKTFIDSFFRESCGYFYSDHINDYVISYDFGTISSLSDVIITCNKLSSILSAGQISSELAAHLTATRDRISALVHASRKGPLPASLSYQRKYLACYVFDDAYRKKQKRSKDLSSLRTHYIEKNGKFFKDIQSSKAEYALVYIPFFVPHRSRHVFHGTKGLDVLLPALYSGRRLKSVIKGKGRWVDLPAFVHSDGTTTLISNIISSDIVWRDRMENVISNHVKR